MSQFASIAFAIALVTSSPHNLPQTDTGLSTIQVIESKAGQFCKAADLGKKKIADNGSRIKCLKDGSRARWKKY
jgi:hypothetical protein